MRWWRRLLAQLGARTPVGRDAVVAAALAVLGIARVPLALVINDGRLTAATWVVVAASAVSTLDFGTLALRRRAPRTALAVATVVVLAGTALPAAYQLTGLGVLVCSYTVATLLPRGAAVTVLAVAAATHAVGGIVATAVGGRVDLVATFWANDGDTVWHLVLASVGTYAVPGLIGLYVQTTRAYAAELAEKVDRLEAERELRVATAAAAERGRIARELHDIAAHDLSAIVVQAGAADRLVDRDPAGARETLRSIRAQGRRTLTAMRELVGVLRARSDDDLPTPSLSMMDALVTAARETGMTVSVRTGGDVAPLSPATDLAAYRLVQEALTNARQHAPGTPVAVTIEYRPAEVVLAIRNGPGAAPVEPADGGHGLAGMRERVLHCGGDLTVGPTADRGWQVAARLPLGDRADQGHRS